MPLQIKAIMMTLTSVVPYLFTFYGYSLLMQTFSDFFRKSCVQDVISHLERLWV